MTEQEGGTVPRTGDRRSGDRRRVDRRAPPPLWRRSWALVFYGVLGALLGVFLVAEMREEEPPAAEIAAAPPVAVEAPPAPAAPPEEAFTTADFERLVIRGREAEGRRVLAELYCAAPSSMALREQAPLEPAVAALRGPQGRVTAAECKWGPRGDERRQDFLLLVPPELADDFAAAPVTTDDFVRRRRIRAEVEWIGRSEALFLRTAGVLRRVLPGS